MLSLSERITILTRRLEKLKSIECASFDTIEERAEAVRECEDALKFAIQEQAEADSKR